MGDKGWFAVDRDGLRQLMDGRDKSFILRELVQNAWDEPGVTRCDVRLSPVEGRALIEMDVEDDAPEGFHDITHAWTLFGHTRKRTDIGKRGRFNLGEKQVLALCESAFIETTKGTVIFDAGGERTRSRRRREVGSIFHGVLRMTRAELAECERTARMFIPPDGIETTVNGSTIGCRVAKTSVRATLMTEHEDTEGQWRKTRRLTVVEVHEPCEGERPMLYEMGLPVVELDAGDRYHYNVMQRVPLTADRDNVSPAFLRDVRAEVMNIVAEDLSPTDAAEVWAREATESKRINEDAFKKVVEKRHGKKVVSFSPGDPEANAQAASRGYVVLSGGSLSGREWENARRFDALESSAKAFPSPRPEFSSDGVDTTVPEEEWTDGMRRVAGFIEDIGRELVGGCVVRIVRDKWNRFRGWYGSKTLTINLHVAGKKFFDEFPRNREDVVAFAIHEFGHEYDANHLSSGYHEALCDLGARCVALALKKPEVFA